MEKQNDCQDSGVFFALVFSYGNLSGNVDFPEGSSTVQTGSYPFRHKQNLHRQLRNLFRRNQNLLKRVVNLKRITRAKMLEL